MNDEEFVHKDYLEHEGRIKELEGFRYKIEKDTGIAFTKIGNALEQLQDMPQTMKSIESTMIGMQGEMQQNKKDLVEIKDDMKSFKKEIKDDMKDLSGCINKVDNKDKISIGEFLKQNLWGIIATIIGVAILVAKYT